MSGEYHAKAIGTASVEYFTAVTKNAFDFNSKMIQEAVGFNKKLLSVFPGYEPWVSMLPDSIKNFK